MTTATRGLPDERVGRVSAALAMAIPVVVAAQAAALAQLDTLFFTIATRPGLLNVALPAVGGGLLVLLVLSGLALREQLRRAARSRGRLRLLLVGAGGVLSGLSVAGLSAWAFRLASDPGPLGAGFGELGVAAPALAAAAMGPGALLSLVGSLSCWNLLSPTARQRFWWVADTALAGVFVWALWTLPLQPPATRPNALALPVLRHVVTALAVLRIITRLLPRALDLVERAGFRAMVAARHLRAKKSGFLATIAVLSIVAVMLSCFALTVTLSVMGGFRQDLKRKILGNNAHIVVDRERGHIEGWAPMVQRAAATEGVVGASPFVSGEVMISSASNLATAVLRGIDLRTVGKVNDLERNLKSGKLDYLRHPEQLLDVPAEAFGGSMLPPVLEGDEPPAAPTPEEAAQRKALEEKLAEIEEMLRESRRAVEAQGGGTATTTTKRDVLPGIIIGQELARSLRLYVGDEVNVVAPLGALGPSGPMPKSRPFRIAGIFYSGMYEYDMKFTYVELGQGQRFLGTGDAISGIEVKVEDTERAPSIAAIIEGALDRDELRVQDWQRLNSRLFGALALEKLAMFVTLGIAILVASFCIAGTLTLMVQEKGREIAVLKAMGSADRAIVGVFVIEGGLIGVLGASLGLFLGYMACFALEHFGIKMNPEVYYIEKLPVHIDPTEFLLTGVSAVFICLLITIYPALQASRLRPVDALRYE